MPKVPENLGSVGNGFGQSPLTSVNPTNLLMAAATMESQGRFKNPSPENKFPNPSQKRPIRKLKVVK